MNCFIINFCNFKIYLFFRYLITTNYSSKRMSNINTQVAATTPFSIYETYKNAGISAPLVILFGFKAAVCLIGVLLNANLVYITWKTKTLRGACNLQIALNALSMSIQESSSFVTFFIAVTGINFIPLGYCGIIQAIPLFCTIFTNGIAFSIGVDRLLSILFPFWYMAHDKRPYLAKIITICAIYASVVPIVGLKVSLENPKTPVMCTVIDPPQKEATWIVIMLLIVNMASVFCYVLVWITLYVKKNMKKKQVNIFKSLSLILILEICGWITNYSIRLIVGAAFIQSHDTWYLVNISTIAPYLSMTLSPVVLYIFSSEYRRAFLCQISCFKSIAVHPSSTAAAAGVLVGRRQPSIQQAISGGNLSQSPQFRHPIQVPSKMDDF